MKELNEKIREFAEASSRGNEWAIQMSLLCLLREILNMISDALLIVTDVHEIMFTHDFMDVLHGDMINMYEHVNQYAEYLLEERLQMRKRSNRKRNRNNRRKNRK